MAVIVSRNSVNLPPFPVISEISFGSGFLQPLYFINSKNASLGASHANLTPILVVFLATFPAMNRGPMQC